MWKFIKKLFTPTRLEKPKIDTSKLTKGDLKKLKAQGKIKDIYNPNK